MNRTQELMEAVRSSVCKDVDTVMIWNYESSSTANTFYLSGFRGSCSILIIHDKSNYIITDSRYFEQAEQETDFILVRHTTGRLANTVVNFLKELSAQVVGFEAERLDFKTYDELSKMLNVRFVPIDQTLYKMRSTKSEEEIDKIRKASRIAEQAFMETLSCVKDGVSEIEICAELEYRIKKLGAQVGFETLIGSGASTSKPHVKPTEKKIQNGELILFDFGARIDGYCCDITRMALLGKPTEEIIECYDLVRESLEKATNEGAAGVIARHVDQVARQVILQSKYAEYCFKYGLGHGIGLEVHESPRMGPIFDEPLPSGAVITVEPGIYIPGKFGIRIENDVIVRDRCFEKITALTEELIAL
ncbi:MAG TPA: aminopeptidase P family protein [Pseudothermotoga sp.]|nr:aminopeptidase P family protein [Pseudothermotoga sp.]HOK83691.1 aminopeptidase P family protein [Pseudothermotoga sp.]HPP69330.1 aminopeptidase P family protein [Pseudothermotoga sp.]